MTESDAELEQKMKEEPVPGGDNAASSFSTSNSEAPAPKLSPWRFLGFKKRNKLVLGHEHEVHYLYVRRYFEVNA